TVGKNKLIDMLRRKTTQVGLALDRGVEERASRDASPVAEAEGRELGERLALARLKLSPVERAVLDDHLTGRSPAEIAQRQGMTKAAAATALHRARGHLEALLAG